MHVQNSGNTINGNSSQPHFHPVFISQQTTAPRLHLVPAPHEVSAFTLSRNRRGLDFSVAFVTLVFLGIPMVLIAILVRLTSKGPALFLQKRVGRNGRLFCIYKFRSMADNAGAGPASTQSGDQRITDLGRWLRKFKLDETPQFMNVLLGHMSLVGPRPKLPIHEPMLNMPYRPGITGAATLAFRNEEEMLRGVQPDHLDHFYEIQIKPLKTRIDLDYMRQASLQSDLRLLVATAVACLVPAPVSMPVPLQDQEAKAIN